MNFIFKLRELFLKPVIVVEAFIVANLAFLAIDIYVAHSTNQFANWAEWIPFVFSFAAPILLLVSYLVDHGTVLGQRPASRTTRLRIARTLGFLIGVLSILVGIAGLLWHLESQFFRDQTLRNLVYAAPFVAPLAYAGLGFLILLNRMVDSSSEEWARWLVLLALGGWIGNFVLSLADHAQNAFFYRSEWISVIASAIGVAALSVALVDYRNRAYLYACIGVMALEIVVGVAGWIFHLIAISNNPMDDMWERIVYSAPLFAPLLFANLAILAIIGLTSLGLQNLKQMS